MSPKKKKMKNGTGKTYHKEEMEEVEALPCLPLAGKSLAVRLLAGGGVGAKVAAWTSASVYKRECIMGFQMAGPVHDRLLGFVRKFKAQLFYGFIYCIL